VTSPIFYVTYCVVTVLVLKEVNRVVLDPYMVKRSPFPNKPSKPLNLTTINVHDDTRTNLSMLHKHKRTATGNGMLGIPKLQLLQDCTSSVSQQIPNLSLRYCLPSTGTFRPTFSATSSCSNAGYHCLDSSRRYIYYPFRLSFHLS